MAHVSKHRVEVDRNYAQLRVATLAAMQTMQRHERQYLFKTNADDDLHRRNVRAAHMRDDAAEVSCWTLLSIIGRKLRKLKTIMCSQQTR